MCTTAVLYLLDTLSGHRINVSCPQFFQQYFCLTFELQAHHADALDVRGGAHVKLPDLGVDAKLSHEEDQERRILLLHEFL